jgi:hypothetical protein
MTGPTYKPDWSEHKDNPDFEHAVYTERLQITGDPLNRSDLVTRSGKPVVIRRIMRGYGAIGTVDGEPWQWYVGGGKSIATGKDLGYMTFLSEADSPHENDVMLPRDPKH